MDKTANLESRLINLNKFLNFGNISNNKLYLSDAQKALNYFNTKDRITKSTGEAVSKICTTDNCEAEPRRVPEMAALMLIFGRTDPENGLSYFHFDDIIKIWIEGDFPEGWIPAKDRPYGLNSIQIGLLSIDDSNGILLGKTWKLVMNEVPGGSRSSTEQLNVI